MTQDPVPPGRGDAPLILTEDHRIGAPWSRPDRPAPPGSDDLVRRIDALRAAIAAGRKAGAPISSAPGQLPRPANPAEAEDGGQSDRIRRIVREELSASLTASLEERLGPLIRREVARALAARRR